MGDAFKGLTIRIGADARPLTSALNSVKSYANQAQGSINRLTRALRFDGSDVAAMSTRIGLMDDKIVLAARSSNMLSLSIREASASAKKLAAETTNIYAAAQRARAGMTNIDATLEGAYDKVIAFKKSFEGLSTEKARSQVEAMKGSVQALAAEVRKMYRAGYELPFGLKANSADQAYFLAKDAFSNFKGLKQTKQSELEAINEARAIRAAKDALVAYNAELRQASVEQARFNAEMLRTGGSESVARARAEIKELDAAVDAASASARKMGAAYEMMPKSIEMARHKLEAIKSEQNAVKAQTLAIQQAIARLESTPGFDRQAAGAADLHVRMAQLTADYAEWNAKVAKVSERISVLTEKQEAARKLADAGSKEEIANLARIENRLRRYSTLLTAIEAKRTAAYGSLKSTAMASEYRDLNEQLAYATAHQQRLSTIMKSGVNWGNIGASIKNMGYAMYSTLTPAIMIGARYAIQAAENVDAAYRNMRKTVNGTEEQFEELKDAAIDFSRTHVTSAETLLEIESLGGQLGIAVENLGGFSEVISSLDIATNIDAEDLATYVGQLSNIMDDIRVHKDDPIEYQKSITSFADALVRLGNNSAAQESNIMNVMMRIASLGNISGFTTPQLLAISDAVAATGQGSEAAGTAISKTFSDIESAVGAGGGSLEAFAKVAGMSAQQFAKSWDKTPMEAFTAFIGGLKRIDAEGGSVDNTLENLKITSVRQKQALMGLTTTYDVMTSAIGMADDAWNGLATDLGNGKVEEAGDAAREAQRKSEGFSGELAMMKNNAVALAIELGNGLVPFMKGLSAMFQDFTAALHEMPDEMKSAISGFLLFAAAIGPVAVGIGSFITGITNIKNTVAKIPTGWNKVVKAFEKKGGVVNALADIGRAIGTNIDAPLLMAMDKAEALKSSLGGGIGMTGAAAIVAIGAVGLGMEINAIVDYYKKLNEHSKRAAEVGVSGFDRMAAASSSAKAKADQLASSYKRVDEILSDTNSFLSEYETWLAGVSSAHETLSKKQEETYSNNAIIDKYAESIEGLMSKVRESGALTEDQQAELSALVRNFNEASGESLTIEDARTAKLKNSKGVVIDTAAAFRDLAESIKEAAIAEVWAEEYAQAAREQVEAKRKKADAQSAYDQAYAKYKEIEARESGWTTHSKDYYDLAQAAQDAWNALKEVSDMEEQIGENARISKDMMVIAAKEAKTEIDKMLVNPELEISFDLEARGKSPLEFANMLNSFDGAQALTPEQVLNVAKEFDGTLKSILPKLKEYGIEMDQLNEQEINDKKFYVTDDGTIYDAEGNLQYLSAVTINDKHYWVGDDGTVYDEKGKIDDLNGIKIDDKTYVVDSKGDVYDQKGILTDLKSISIGDKHYVVTSDGTVKDESGAVGNLDGFRIGDKRYIVDDGGTVYDQTGAVEKLNGVTINNKRYIVDDKGTVRDQLGNVQQLAAVVVDGKTFWVDDNGTIYDEKEKVAKLDDEDVDDKEFSVSDGKTTDTVKKKVSDLISKLNLVKGTYTATIQASDQTGGVLSTIASKIKSALNGSFATGGVSTSVSVSRFAKGAVVRSIPRNAAGGINGIVTGKTLTNVGWVGEAGTEAIMHMKNGAGAIVPLSNRRYVRPFAQAVASEIGGGGTTVVVKTYLNYKAGDDAKKMVRDVARGIRQAVSRGM